MKQNKSRKQTLENAQYGLAISFKRNFFNLTGPFTIFQFPIMHYVCPPNFAYTIVVKCSWEMCIFPRVFHSNSLCKLWGANRVHYGELENREFTYGVEQYDLNKNYIMANLTNDGNPTTYNELFCHKGALDREHTSLPYHSDFIYTNAAVAF